MSRLLLALVGAHFLSATLTAQVVAPKAETTVAPDAAARHPLRHPAPPRPVPVAAPLSDERIAELERLLTAEPAFPGRPADDRAAWSRLAERPDVRRFVRLAEFELRSPTPELPHSLFEQYLTRGNRDYERPFNRRTERLSHFVIAECIEDRGRFLPAIEAELGAILDEPTWAVPAHWYPHGGERGVMVVDLAATARAWTLAVTDRWLARRLADDTRQRIRSEIRRRVWTPYLETVRSAQPLEGIRWPRAQNNWNAVCHAGVVGSALALVDDPRERAEFLAGAESYLAFFLHGFGTDGSCSEGVAYWNYGFGHFAFLADTVRTATMGRLDWLAGEHIRRIANYPGGLEIVPGVFPAYADGAVTVRPSAWLLDHLERRLALGRAAWRATRPPEPPLYHPLGATLYGAAMTFFDFTGAETPAAPGTAPASVAAPLREVFEEAQVFTLRPDPAHPRLALSLKGGHNDEHHNHNDVGTYVVVLDGRPLLLDPGGETYTSRTFSARRYESRLLASYGHPVPVLNGAGQATGRAHAATVLSTAFADQADEVVLDLADAYDAPTVRSLVRRFRLSRGAEAEVVIQDEPVFSAPGTYGTALITFGTFERSAPDELLVREGARALRIRIDTEGRPFEVVDEVLPEKPMAGGQARRIGITLRETVEQARITLRITPASPPPVAAAKPMPPSAAPAGYRTAGDPVRIEAEDYVSESGGEAQISLRRGSESLALRTWSNDGHTVGWTVKVARPGLYALRGRYAHGGSRPVVRTLRLGTADVRDVELAPTGGWSSDRDDWQVAWLGGDEAATFVLSAGEHRLELRADGQALNLDWLELVPVQPTATP
jgi:hypothetical protein